jgi:hypothetical protein
MKNGIIYRGPSLIDGAPIVVVAIASDRNKKTGNMLHTYILRADIDPRDASKSGADRSICGDCPMRGAATDNPDAKQAAGRGCYVLLGQGPLIVWRALSAGLYPNATSADDVAAIGAGRMVRIGTYGDGAAVPAYVWRALLSRAIGHTGYSHQAKTRGAAFDQSIFMVSCETEKQARSAWRKGARTFRVIDRIDALVKGSEILCPASKEAGRRVQCADCGLCAGNTVRAKSIAIVAHGAGKKHAIAA